MLALHHPHVLLLAWLFIDAACALVLVAVASARGQSKWFGLWSVLGFAGLIAGLLIMLALPVQQPPAAPPTQPPATA